jgi:transposase
MTQSNKQNVRSNLEQLNQAIDESGLDEYQYMKRTLKAGRKKSLIRLFIPTQTVI